MSQKQSTSSPTGLAVITVRDEGSGIPADFLPRITVRLVALTGYGQATDIAMALAAGFDAHLVKPIDADTVAAIVKQ